MFIRDETRFHTEKGRGLESLIQTDPGGDWFLSIMVQANQVADVPDTIHVIRGMLDLMIEITLADSGYFLQLDPDSDELVIKSIRGYQENQHLIGLRINRQQGLPGISINGAQPVVIGELPSDPDWLRTIDPEGAARKRNVINLPIANKDCTLGVIQIFNYKQADLDLLQVLSNRLAVEIEHRNKLDIPQRSNQMQNTPASRDKVVGTLNHNSPSYEEPDNLTLLVDSERRSVFLVCPDTNDVVVQVTYRSSLTVTEILSYLRENAGSLFDPSRIQPLDKI